MRRTLTAAALLGVFVIAPAGSAFADPATIRGNAYGNCGVNSHFQGPSAVTLEREGGSYAKQTQGSTPGERDSLCRPGNSNPPATVVVDSPPPVEEGPAS